MAPVGAALITGEAGPALPPGDPDSNPGLAQREKAVAATLRPLSTSPCFDNWTDSGQGTPSHPPTQEGAPSIMPLPASGTPPEVSGARRPAPSTLCISLLSWRKTLRQRMCGSPLAVRQAVGSASRSRSEPLASHRARSSQTVGVPRIASGAFRVTEPPGKREDHVQTLRLAARALTQQRAHGPGAGNSSPRETSSGQGQGQRGTGRSAGGRPPRSLVEASRGATSQSTRGHLQPSPPFPPQPLHPRPGPRVLPSGHCSHRSACLPAVRLGYGFILMVARWLLHLQALYPKQEENCGRYQMTGQHPDFVGLALSRRIAVDPVARVEVGSVCVLHDDRGAGRERVETKWKGFPGDKPRGILQGLRFEQKRLLGERDLEVRWLHPRRHPHRPRPPLARALEDGVGGREKVQGVWKALRRGPHLHPQSVLGLARGPPGSSELGGPLGPGTTPRSSEGGDGEEGRSADACVIAES
uniref:Uncharacterized protein n=1 Tax=Rangifer tarandus platyrhynchus TaxID=3082113 RepID=A0ACB0EVJ7_RANTA|nr:unnamed protein product [Rangifer tarandus platyrhynchus]